jgi:two-component sensor histidine kinase
MRPAGSQVPGDAEAIESALRLCDPPGCEILKEADHRVSNALAQLAATLRLKLVDFDSAELGEGRLLLQGVLASLESVSRLHRILATQGAGAPVDLADYLRSVCPPVFEGTQSPVLVEDFESGCLVNADQVQPIGQIVIEAVTNAIKHSRRRAERGSILVSCRAMRSGSVVLEVVDSGQGNAEPFASTSGAGLGFRIMRALASQLGALVDFRSTPLGGCFRLALPRAAGAGHA